MELLVERQGGLCPICQVAAAEHVDHDHFTGDVRGILCAGCNTGMGQLRDDPWVVRRAIEYLTGGLFGLLLDDDGCYEVAVVRTRRSEGAVEPGGSWGGPAQTIWRFCMPRPRGILRTRGRRTWWSRMRSRPRCGFPCWI
ncbi:endonuclease VII domain-containing protein [Actinoallomurus sp. NPDC050550]|uniref:endonuclease VII domain-containing protein n=1 Tax=Actinoallomurus sp. NPDC050550 TaxID=3154937 RepID=UPI0033E1EA99